MPATGKKPERRFGKKLSEGACQAWMCVHIRPTVPSLRQLTLLQASEEEYKEYDDLLKFMNKRCIAYPCTEKQLFLLTNWAHLVQGTLHTVWPHPRAARVMHGARELHARPPAPPLSALSPAT